LLFCALSLPLVEALALPAAPLAFLLSTAASAFLASRGSVFGESVFVLAESVFETSTFATSLLDSGFPASDFGALVAFFGEDVPVLLTVLSLPLPEALAEGVDFDF